MNKQLSPKEMLEIAVPIPQPKPKPAMTRRDKLMHWAGIVRKYPHYLRIFHGLEYCNQAALDAAPGDQSAFALAAADPVLVEAGLKSNTIGASMRFFELNHKELHAFSCDCGGVITNTEMANRIEKIADPTTHPGMFRTFLNW